MYNHNKFIGHPTPKPLAGKKKKKGRWLVKFRGIDSRYRKPGE